MKITQVNLLLFTAMLFLGACVLSKGKESPKAPIIKLLLAIEEGPCKGKCSQYKAEFFSGQKMVYHGITKMPVLGNYAYLIPEQLPKNLLAEALTLKLAELPDSLPSEDGEQRIQIRILLPDGKIKIISAGGKTGPSNFRTFVKMLDSEVRAMVEDQEGEKIP
jgi:hypothetical protein